jgi:hypothetical protein
MNIGRCRLEIFEALLDKFPLESTTISIRSVVSWPAKFNNTQTLDRADRRREILD